MPLDYNLHNGFTNTVWGLSPLDIEREYGSPVYLYSAEKIITQIKKLQGFDVVRYAQKALPNISILKLMREQGIVVDAVTAGEIFRAVTAGYCQSKKETPDVVYTADVLDPDAYDLINKYEIPINIGSPDMLEQVARHCPLSEIIFRINPGFGHGHSLKTNTGGELSKHGIWHTQLESVLSQARELKLAAVGLHMHIGSGTDMEHLKNVAHAMKDMALRFGSSLKIISAGGGISIPYKSGSPHANTDEYSSIWQETKKEIENSLGKKIRLEIEPGRFLVAEAGVLLVKVLSVKTTGNKKFVLVNAGFDTLVRPAMYGSYHELSVCKALTSSINTNFEDVVVAGPLCESGDVFTQEEGGVVVSRKLPSIAVGDLLIVHDAGAYGSSMASNYNSRLLAPELLVKDMHIKVIRKKQNLEELVCNEI
jgi:diaminopimelate decarboxylase